MQVMHRVWMLLLLLAVTCCSAGKFRDTSFVKYVHLISMNHLDVGFDGIMPIVGFGYNVVNKYFDVYFPLAIQVGNQLKQLGGQAQLIYTTHPWLVSLYLDCPTDNIWGSYLHCPNATMVAAFQQAVRAGIIAWHAYPFNTEPELYDASLFAAGISIGKNLSAQFGLPAPNTMSQRDVPGMSRSVIPLLRAAGVQAITIGVNPVTSPPAVPSLFRWTDPPSGQSIWGMLHPGGYGGIDVTDCVTAEGFPHALAPGFRSDNQGPPPTAQDVQQWFSQLQEEFPNATIMASTWDTFTNLLEQYQPEVPEITQEMGDTWIHGCASDPLKMAQFRAVMAVRSACIADNACDPADAEFGHFDRMLLKLGEHTWGLDVKTFLNDTANWTNQQFEAARGGPNFQLLVQAWVEQRSFLGAAIAALEGSAKYRSFAATLNATLQAVANPQLPSTQKYEAVSNFSSVFSAGQWAVQFDAATGAIASLLNTQTNTQYASSKNLLGLLQYETYTAADYDAFFDTYFYFDASNTSWAAADFGKPNVSSAGPTSATYVPAVEAMWTRLEEDGRSFILELSMPKPTWTQYGASASVWLQVKLSGSSVGWWLWLANKTTTRLPEGIFFTFNPVSQPQDTWAMSKLGEFVATSDIMQNGSFHIHGVDQSGVQLTRSNGDKVVFKSPDVPIVCLGTPTAFPTPFQTADMTQGFSFMLYNNIWGTNYIMWYPYLSEDATLAAHFIMNV